MEAQTVATFEEWRAAARQLLAADIAPADVRFNERSAQRGLFADTMDASSILGGIHSAAAVARVPRNFLEIARRVACHRDLGRFELLYRILWRLTHGESYLLEVEMDDDVRQLQRKDQAVRRDAYKMQSFVRFRRIQIDGGERFVAWHRPDHYVVRLVAPFFSRRFPQMEWSILTPDVCVHWDKQELTYAAGVPMNAGPRGDELEGLWKTYYSSIFNPARANVKTMKREMPVRYWHTLPETEIIPDLLADAPRRVAEMTERGAGCHRSAAEFLPAEWSIETLREAAANCQGCNLFCNASQIVFGQGPTPARLMLVGEQPGDMEDLSGRPFVGPAGKVLDEALQEVGLARDAIYMTNAVKHFKFVFRGKRRIHNKPSIQEAIACRPWLLAELEMVRPEVLVCLGATAAQSIISSDFRITRGRGQLMRTDSCEMTIATYHPSAVLRAPNPVRRDQRWSYLTADLMKAKMLLV